MMKVCASDLDGTLATCDDELDKRVREEFGIDPYAPHIKDSFYMHERHGIDEELMRKFLFSSAAFDDPNLWFMSEPFEDRIIEMNRWAMNGNIPSIITARPPMLRHITELWLSKFHVPYSNLLMGAGKCKGKLSWHIDASFMVEDNYGEAIGVAEHGIKCYLMREPYNKYVEETDNIILVDTYQEITEREGL